MLQTEDKRSAHSSRQVTRGQLTALDRKQDVRLIALDRKQEVRHIALERGQETSSQL
jgi:hypothetical protein